MKRFITVVFLLVSIASFGQYNWIGFNDYNRSPSAVNGNLWRYNNHLYVKLGGTDYQLDQQTSSITASNGLTKVGSDIQYGGTFLQNNTVDLDQYILTLTSSQLTSRQSIFNSNSGGTSQLLVGLSTPVNLAMNYYAASAGGTTFGLSHANRGFLVAEGSTNLGMGIGTIENVPLTFGTNDIARLSISSSGVLNIATSPSTDNTATEILSRDGSGNVVKRTDLLDGTIAANRVLIGVDANTATTDTQLQYDPTTDYLSLDKIQPVTSSAFHIDNAKLFLNTQPDNNDANTNILSWNTGTGEVEYRLASTFLTATDLGYTATTGELTSSTGTDVTLPIKQITVNISNANFLLIDSAPYTLVAAQGANTYINVISAIAKFNWSTGLAAFNASDDIVIKFFTNEGTNNGTLSMDNGTVNQSGLTAARGYKFLEMDPTVSLQGSTPVNTALVLGMLNGGSISSGDATVDIKIVYTVETF